MCYNIALLQNKWNRLEKRYGKRMLKEHPEPEQPSYFISGFDHPEIPVITEEGITLAHWGLIPHWCKTEKDALSIRQKTLNAMSETAAEKPSFRESWKKGRCLIPVSGFFEWHQFAGQKYPIYVSLKETEIFSLAGLISAWENPVNGNPILSCSILTTTANDVMSIVHNSKKRMPVILTDKSENQWLQSGLSSHSFTDELEMELRVCSQKLNQNQLHRNQSWAQQKEEYPQLLFSEIASYVRVEN